MDIPIFFLQDLANTDVITLSEETSKHIVQVLRMKANEKLQLADGAGNLLTAEIVDNHKKKCTVKIIKRQVIVQKQQKVCIAISLLKNASRFEWFLEKATEIGVSEIIPLLCDRTEKQHFRFSRMNQIVISAMLQSKQSWLPVLQQPVSFFQMLQQSSYQTKLIAHCEQEMKELVTDYRKEKSVQILIGPEGDFSPNEISLALANNFKPVALGETRLRTETAGVVAATVLCV